MTVHIVQGRYTDQAIKGMVQAPEDRAPAVAALIEACGGRMLHYFVTFGDYDFMVISEGADDDRLMAGLLAAAASGGVTDLRTTRAMSTDHFKSAAENAKKLIGGFKAAGSS
jgi:uncharacterized protein with GYD domain